MMMMTTTTTNYTNHTPLWSAERQTTLQQMSAAVPAGCLVLSRGTFIPWDNPDNLVSQHVERAVDEAVAVVCLPVLFALSAVTNALNVLVFWRQGLRQRVNLCLFSLSLADLLYMLHAFLLNADRLALHLRGGGGGGAAAGDPAPPGGLGLLFEFIVRHKMVGFRGLSWVSGFLSTLIACERCLCVVSPLRSRTVLKTSTTGALIAVSSLLIMAGFFLVCTRWDIACVFDPATNATSSTIYGSQFYVRHKVLLDVLDGIVYGLVLPGLYVSVVLVTTGVTLFRLRRSSDWRQQASSASSSSSDFLAREVALTRMLIGVSVLYVLCTLPTLALGLCILLVPEFNLRGRYYNAFNLMVSVFELSSYLNASVNFFVYCTLGSRYKDTLRALFSCGGARGALLPSFFAGKRKGGNNGDGAK